MHAQGLGQRERKKINGEARATAVPARVRRERMQGVEEAAAEAAAETVGKTAAEAGARTVVGHGEDGELSDGAITALDTAGTLIDSGQISVHVAGVAAAAGHLLAGGGDLAEGVGVGRHVGEDDEDVQVALVGEVLGGGEGEAGRDDALDGGVVGQVQKERGALHGPALLEVVAEEAGRLHVHAHGAEHDGEVLLVPVHRVLLLHQRRLPGDLRRHLVVRQAGRREDRDLLPARHRVHHVDRRDPRLDHRLRVVARRRVDGLPVDVQVRLGQHLRRRVDHLARPVERPAQHLLRDAHLQHVPGELALGLAVVDAGRALEHLHHGAGPGHLQHLSGALGSVSQSQVHDFGVFGQLHVVQDDQGSVHSCNGAVFVCVCVCHVCA